MVRMIDADAIERCLVIGGRRHGKTIISEIIRRAIQAAPTVDAEPVRHGQWEYVDYGGFGNWHCSHCREICITNGDYDYCPNCGARMDAE